MPNAANDFLTAEQDALIDALFTGEGLLASAQEGKLTAPAQLANDKENRYQPFPLTDIQQGYWLGRGAGFELGSVSCYGYVEIDCVILEPERLERAVQTVAERHDMLRARILPSGQQEVLEYIPYPLVKVVDLSSLTEELREAARLHIRASMSQQVLDASQAPLFDIRLSTGPGKSARLHFGIDSLICDQASLRLILRDMVAAYQNPDQPLPAPAIGFRDYVLRLAQDKDSAESKKAENYWMGRLDTLPPAPQIPLARPFGEIQQPSFARVEAALSPSEWRSFQSNAAKASVTPSNALAAAFALTLGRWCRQEAMTLNLTLFDRQPLHPDIAEVVGDFTAVTLLEADLAGAPSFRELCSRIQDRLMQDIEHAAFSGVEVLRELSRKQGRPGEALMPVVFTSTIGLRKLEKTASDEAADGAEIPASFGKRGFTLSQTPQVALDHHLFERAGQLDINWDYCAEAFPDGLIEDMFSAYLALARELAASPHCWEKRLCATLPARQQERREAYNKAEAPFFSAEELLASGFIRQATAQPESPALIDARECLSYGEASIQAEAWAQLLESKGISPGDAVIAMLPKGWQQCVTALATSALGVSYTPVDLAVPPARLQAIEKALGAKAILALPGAGISSGLPVIELRRQTDSGPGLSLREGIKPTDIAYVIFTSGSTGTPKGVVIDHRGALNTIHDVNRRFGVGTGDRVLALSAFSFDLSVYDIFGMLAAGGALVLPDADKDRDPAHWAALMRAHAVSLWNTTPAMLQMLSAYLDYHPAEVPSGLRMAWLSGDWIPLDLVPAVRRHWPKLKIISMGGATEASIWSIYYPIEGLAPGWRSIPYGKPLGGQKMHVLDKELEASPEWVPGEIYISGLGLAKGYINDAEKTDAHFIIHPKSGEPYYRTGDMGRFHPEGYIEFLGREDQQVKINGFRVELGEIESALLQSPDVEKAVAVSLDSGGDAAAQKTLAAFVTPKVDAEPLIFLPPRHAATTLSSMWERVLKEGRAAQEQDLGRYDGEWAAGWFGCLEKLALAMINNTLNELGALPEGAAPQALPELMASAGIAPRYARLLAQWCGYLTKAGYLVRSQSGWRRLAVGPGQSELLQALEEAQALAGGNEALLQLLSFYETCALNHIQLLTGQLDPLEFVFPAGDWKVARTLYEEQPVSRCINLILARMAACAVAGYAKDGLRILELRTGVGAATASLLPALAASGLLEKLEYSLTDLSPVFLSRACERFEAYPSVSSRLLDPNKPFAPQGLEAFSQDLVIAANVLHGVADIGTTLQEIYEALSPGGLLCISEGFASHPILSASIGFLEGFTAFADEREQRNSPFLDADEWREKLAGAGFAECVVYPEEGHPLRGWGQGVIVALKPGGIGQLDEAKARELVGRYTPDYMVPARICALPRLPITSNGKVDRKALAARVSSGASALSAEHVAPQGELENMLAEIWKEGLGLEEVSATASLFTLGGDSLFAVQMNNRISDVFEVNIPLMEILRKPTVSAVAALVEKAIYEDLQATEANS